MLPPGVCRLLTAPRGAQHSWLHGGPAGVWALCCAALRLCARAVSTPALANSPRTLTRIQVRVVNSLNGRDSANQKAKMAFDACNVDGQGTIDREELFNICRQYLVCSIA